MSDNANVKLIGAGLALGVLVTLAGVGVLSLVGGDDPAETTQPSESPEAAPTVEQVQPTPLTPEETRQMLDDALAETRDDDPEWAAEAEAAVIEAFADEPDLATTEDLDVTCSARLCRLTTVVPGAATNIELTDLVLFTAAQRLAPLLPRAISETQPAADGAIELRIWLARDGYHLPTEGGGPIE